MYACACAGPWGDMSQLTCSTASGQHPMCAVILKTTVTSAFVSGTVTSISPVEPLCPRCARAQLERMLPWPARGVEPVTQHPWGGPAPSPAQCPCLIYVVDIVPVLNNHLVGVLWLLLFLRFYLLLLEREEERKKDKERNVNVREIHQLVASRTPPAGDLVHSSVPWQKPLSSTQPPAFPTPQQCLG